MAPINKKVKKNSKKLKSKKSKTLILKPLPLDSGAAVDCDWWDSFWSKNYSSAPATIYTPFSSINFLILSTIYSESNVLLDEEEGFKYFFRVSKKTFEYICSLVREDLISRPPSGLINIEGRLLSVEKQVAIALRRLASGESQVSVGASFGVGQSTVSQMTWRFIESLEEHARHHLTWPGSDKMKKIKSGFEASFGLPNCCGAIDATHVIMTLPAVEISDDWCDQEKNYSMFLQGIVDHELRFLDIVTGWPGGMTLSRLLKFSCFYKLCENGDRLNGNNITNEGDGIIREYIIGGDNYPLLPWLITPYEHDNNLSTATSAFNNLHEAARSVAVKAFAQLKGSWRILNKVLWRPDKQKLPSIILVCCLLHNIMIDCGDGVHPDVLLLGHHDAGYVGERCMQINPLGETLRDNIAKWCFQNARDEGGFSA